MAIVKKVVTKKLVEPKIVKTIIYRDEAEEKDFLSLEELVKSNPCVYDTPCSVSIDNKEINYDVSELPHCCGLLEIGNITITKLIDIKELTRYFDLLVQFTKGKTIIINTNGINSSIILEAALKNCKNWTAVKNFRNNRNGNTITMWVSNND